jgi:hypothetical protein
MISIDQFKEAAWAGDFEVVKKYIENGGNVNTCASNGVNALVSFNIRILEYLYKHKADPGVIWNDGNPAICFHAWELNFEAVK